MIDYSYKPCEGCGAGCPWFDEESDEPCWGQVEVYEEVEYGDGDYGWLHACKGHINLAMEIGPYIPCTEHDAHKPSTNV